MGQELVFEKIRFRDIDIPEFIKTRIADIFGSLVFLISLPPFTCANEAGLSGKNSWERCPKIIKPVIILDEDGKLAFKTVKEGCKQHGISGGVRLSRPEFKRIIERLDGEGKNKILELAKNIKDEPRVQRSSQKNVLRPGHNLPFIPRSEMDEQEEIEVEKSHNRRPGALDAMNFRPSRERFASDKIAELEEKTTESGEGAEELVEELGQEEEILAEMGSVEKEKVQLEAKFEEARSEPRQKDSKPTSPEFSLPPKDTPTIDIRVDQASELSANGKRSAEKGKKGERDMKKERDTRDISVRQKEGLETLWNAIKSHTGDKNPARGDLYFKLYDLFKVPPAALVKVLFGLEPADFNMKLNKDLARKLEKNKSIGELTEFCRELMSKGKAVTEDKKESVPSSASAPNQVPAEINHHPLAVIRPIDGAVMVQVPEAAFHLFKGDGAESDCFVVFNSRTKQGIRVVATPIDGDLSILLKKVEEISLADLKERTLEPSAKIREMLEPASIQ
ncbi:MAG: hypothetical protein V1845_03245 [bacterium]